MKALIYSRVSSQRQVDEGHGLDGQEKRCRDYAKLQGYLVVKVFRDEAISGEITEKNMQELIAYLDEQEDEFVVIVDDIKRFARDVEGHFRLKTMLYARGATVESPGFRFEDTPEGKFVETVMAGTAELERNQNKRQVKNRMKARLEAGYWTFMPPLGLVNKKDLTHGKILTPKEPEASLLKKAIEGFKDGILITQEEVKNYLDKEFKTAGLTIKSPSLSTIPMILKNPLYAGYIAYEKWKVPFMKAKHEGFISLDTYNINQERLQSRTKPWKRRDYSDMFPLRPHVLCTACDKPMTASYCTGRKGIRYPHYFCRNKGCIYNWKTTGKDKFEKKFEELLVKVKPKADMVDLTIDVLQEQWGIRLEQYTRYRTRIESEFREAKESIEWYVERARKAKDEALISTYEEKIKELKAQEKQSGQDRNKQIYTSEQFGTASDKVFNALKNPVSMWKSDEYNDKRTILFMYFEEELRYDYKLGFGTAGLAYPIKLINEVSASKNGSVEMSECDSESKKV